MSDTTKIGSRKTISFQHLNSDNKLLLFGPAIFVFIFNIALFNRYFPLTEGWWETYGYLINRGLVPYKDFNLAFPPLIVLLHAFLLKHVSGNFLILRIIGVVLYSLLVFLVQLFLEKYFERKIAAVAVIFAVFLSMSNSAFIAKDYHTYVDLFVVLALIIGQSFFKSIKSHLNQSMNNVVFSFKPYLYLILLGAVVALLTLTKQNIGVFLFLSYVLCIIIVPSGLLKNKVALISIYSIAFLIIFSFFLYYLSSESVSVFDVTSKIFLKNDSKGGGFTVLFRFVLDPFNRKILALSLVLLTIYSLVIYVPFAAMNRAKKYISKYISAKENSVAVNYLAIATLIPAAYIILILSDASIYYKSIMPLSLFILMQLFLKVYFINKKDDEYDIYSFTVIPLLILAYCNTQTAGFNYTGMFFIIAFSFAYLLSRLVIYTSIKPVYFFLVLLSIIPFIAVSKYLTPYEWWGLPQSSIDKSKYGLDYEQTKGIHVDSITKEAYDVISDSIKNYSKSDSDVYLFPDIPIFYYLHNKIPPYKNVVQWFDVLSTKDGEDEFQHFKMNPPNVIVFLDPPDFVYKGHAGLIKRPLIQLRFKKEFDKLVEDGNYELSKYIIYNQSLSEIYSPEEVLVKIIVKNDRFVNKNLTYLYNEFKGEGEIVVKAIIKDGVYMDVVDNETVISKDNELLVAIDKMSLRKIVEKIGYLDKNEYYSIKIYKKKNI